MHISYKATHFDMTPSVQEYFEKKVEGVAKLLEHLDSDGSAKMEVELSRTTSHHRKGDVFRAEAHLTIPKKTFYVSEERDDMYAAIDALKDTLHTSIERYKDFMVGSRKA